MGAEKYNVSPLYQNIQFYIIIKWIKEALICFEAINWHIGAAWGYLESILKLGRKNCQVVGNQIRRNIWTSVIGPFQDPLG